MERLTKSLRGWSCNKDVEGQNRAAEGEEQRLDGSMLRGEPQ